MEHFTKLEDYIREAKFRTKKEAAVYFNMSPTVLCEIISGKYERKVGHLIRLKEYIVFKLSEKLKRKLTIDDVFPD